MFHTIVWATDGHESDGGPERYVRGLVEHDGRELRIVHVVAAPAAPRPDAGGKPRPDADGGEDRLLARLRAQTRALRRDGINASLHVIRGVVGSVAPAIAQLAESVGADLLVVGDRRSSESATGETLRPLLAAAPCPVLVLRGARGSAYGAQAASAA